MALAIFSGNSGILSFGHVAFMALGAQISATLTLPAMLKASLMPDLPLPTAGGDARAARWMPVDEVLGGERPLAFDHRRIIGDAVERARGLLEYSTLGAAFCADRFAISDLRRIYEIVWGQRLDPGNFSRKVTGVEGFLVPTGEHSRDGGRPAALYRRGPATTLHPPLLRAGH